MKFKAISLLTVSVLLATASPAMAGNNSHTEVRTPLSISALELHSVSKTIESRNLLFFSSLQFSFWRERFL